MEILKGFIIPVFVVFFVVTFSHTISGQDFKATENAFKQSYEQEKKGEYNEAIESLKSVYSEDSYEINLRLGWLSYLLGSFTESSSYYQRAVSLKPYAVEAYFGYVYPLAAVGNWNIVKTQYFKILEIDPMNSLANFRMGMIYYGGQDYATALNYFEKVVNLYPFDYDGTIMFAWTKFQLGKLREAEVLFKKALLMRPGDSSALEGLGLIK